MLQAVGQLMFGNLQDLVDTVTQHPGRYGVVSSELTDSIAGDRMIYHRKEVIMCGK